MTTVLNIGSKELKGTPETRALRFFYGDKDSPFLAPRGVHTVNGKLLVADTAQNRIFIWNSMPDGPWQTPDLILGQISHLETGRNQGGKASAATFQYPSGLWSDGNYLIVADAWNHRVLIWNRFPTVNNQPADVVLGQPDMEQNLPNVAGVGTIPSSRNLYWPYGVWSDGVHLWIADTGNRRTLFYNSIPQKNYTAADDVIGKSSFDEKDYETQHAVWPYSVKLSQGGVLAITDTQSYRVLIWNNWRDAFTQPADTVIGQHDLDSCGQNQYRLAPDAGSLNWCYDTCFHGKSFYIADTGNSRILYYSTIPDNNGSNADGLFGNLSFGSIGEHLDVGKQDSERLYWPFSISPGEEELIVADTGNHRIVFYPFNPYEPSL